MSSLVSKSYKDRFHVEANFTRHNSCLTLLLFWTARLRVIGRVSAYVTDQNSLLTQQVRRPRAVNIKRRDGGKGSNAAIGAAAPLSAMRGHAGGPGRVTGSKRVSISQPEITGVEVRCFDMAACPEQGRLLLVSEAPLVMICSQN